MIRIIIADDHTLFRLGLRQMLHSFAGLDVVREATDATEALAAARRGERRPVIILDLTMPGASGTSLIEQIRAACPALPILVLSMHDEPGTVQARLAGRRLGLHHQGLEPGCAVPRC
jgi:DNA-binding NarL/FixJ family response regulator